MFVERINSAVVTTPLSSSSERQSPSPKRILNAVGPFFDSNLQPSGREIHRVTANSQVEAPDSQFLENAINKVKEGKTPLVFVKVLNEEEIKILDSLSPIEAKCAVRKLLPRSCWLSEDSSINIDQLKVEKAYEILKRMKEKLNSVQFDHSPFAKDDVRGGWHTDGNRIVLNDLQTEILRATFAIKGHTTQFFVPTEGEYQRFLEINDYQLILNEVNAITEENPDRLLFGTPYDMCIFHTNVIHRSPPSSNQDRVFITFFTSLNTTEISLQRANSPFNACDI